MITGSYKDNDILKTTTDFYVHFLSHSHILEKFNIFYTNDIMKDIAHFNDGHNSSILCDGVTIVPTSEGEKLTILMNQDAPIEFQAQYIFHELSHVNDFVLFANKYCNGDLFYIRENKYFSTLKYWSEFHVQLYTMPYNHLYLRELRDKNCYDEFIKRIPIYYDEFGKQIPDYYAQSNNIFFQREEIKLLDIMYYIGKIVMCNLYDNNVNYSIHKKISDTYPFIDSLKQILSKCLDFESFCKHINDLYDFLNTLLTV